MMASIDGRIVTDGWPLSPEGHIVVLLSERLEQR
jgi:hypothetical protein